MTLPGLVTDRHKGDVLRDVRSLASDCVHCGFCLPTCPTYSLWHEEMDSPRGRIQLMETHVGTRYVPTSFVQHIDRCLGCMACVTSCPSGVRYDRLVELARRDIERSYPRQWSERALRWTVFRVLPYPERIRPALRAGRLGRAVPLPGRLRPLADLAPPWRCTDSPSPVTPARGETRGRVGILTGCVQSVVFGDVNVATARVLAAAGYDVVAPPQGCCGALSAHAGRATEAHRFTERLRRAFADVDAVVVNSAGCGSHLKDRGLPALDVTEAVVAAPAPLHPLGLRVAYHDSCHLRHAQRLPGAWEPLLRMIPELELVEPAEQDLCCGSAGIHAIVQPAAARELGDRKAAHVLSTQAQVLASANPGCLVQLAQALRRAGQPLPALHPVELLDASLRGVPAGRLRANARR